MLFYFFESISQLKNHKNINFAYKLNQIQQEIEEKLKVWESNSVPEKPIPKPGFELTSYAPKPAKKEKA